MNNVQYRQCLLRRMIGEGFVQQTCWIPSRFAKVGRTLRIRDRTHHGECFPDTYDEWVDGWVVIDVGAPASEDLVQHYQRQEKQTRRVSDI